MMVTMKIFVSVCVALFIFLNVDKSEANKSKSSPINIIVILDTSNRISEKKNPGQVERDKEIVRSIVDLFDGLVSDHFATLRMGDPIEYPHRLTVVVPNQPGGVRPIPDSILTPLTIEHQRGGRDAFTAQKEAFLKGIDDLYAFVQKQNKFTGSDIWNWFRLNAKYDFREGARNCIICVSDGYLNFDRDIQARRPEGTYMPSLDSPFRPLLPIGENFDDHNAKFMMVGITPLREIIHDDIINKYWNTWLNSMGIVETEFIQHLPPNTLKKAIEKFMRLR